MPKRNWVGPICLLLSACTSGPPGVLVDLDSWPAGAVSLTVAGSLDGTPSTQPLSFPSDTTRFVVYVPEGQSGQLSLTMTAFDQYNCPRASAQTQVAVQDGLKPIVETQVTLTPATPPYCAGPSLDGFMPGLGPTIGGMPITALVHNLLPGFTLTVAGTPVTDLTMSSSMVLTGTLPATPGAFGLVPIVLSNPDGQTASRSDLLAYYSNTLRFASMAPYTTKANPTEVAIGDWNGDGRADVAVSTGYSTVDVLLGDGQGGFGAANSFGVDSDDVSVATGDFNGDKNADLAVIAYGTNSAKILIGDGTGNFQLGTVIITPLGIPGRVTVADVNGDSLLDLIVPCSNPNTVAVLLGNGVGGFALSGAFPVGMSPTHAAVGDFNGDQKMDLAVSNAASGNVSILLGDGKGMFAPAAVPSVTAGNTASSVEAADFNGDRLLDLVVANTGDRTVSVLLGDGTGHFGPATDFDAGGSAPYYVLPRDMDGDGRMDLVIATNGDSQVHVLRGNGKGAFGTVASVATGSGPRAVAVGDFNGDKKPDLVTANYDGVSISVLLNQSL